MCVCVYVCVSVVRGFSLLVKIIIYVFIFKFYFKNYLFNFGCFGSSLLSKLSLVVVSRGYSLLAVHGLHIVVTYSRAWALGYAGFRSCGAPA